MPDKTANTPSPKQAELLRQLFRFRRKYGYSPTLEELGRTMGISKVTAYQYIRALERKGLVRRLRHRARSIEIVEEAQLPVLLQDPPLAWRLVGRLHADGRIRFFARPRTVEPDLLVRRCPNVSLLQVSGTSLADRGVGDGDYLLIEPLSDRHVRPAALVQRPEGRIELCRLARRNGRLYARPDQGPADVAPAPVSPSSILGVVVGLLRMY